MKLEGLLLRTVRTTILVDSTFLKDVRVSLLSNPLALEFKQSYADFRLQNGQIKYPNSQTLDSEILDPLSPSFIKSNTWIHKSQEGKRPQDDTDSIYGWAFILSRATLSPKWSMWTSSFLILSWLSWCMTFWLQQNQWNLYCMISGGQRCRILLRIMLQHVTYVPVSKFL